MRELLYSEFLFSGSYEISFIFQREETILPIALDYVRCNGSENALKNCIHFSHSYGCTHEDGVEVYCAPGR